MKLEDIGFYTLSDARALSSSAQSPLYRCEMILTDRCNFACPYCRGAQDHQRGDMPIKAARETLALWFAQGLKNVRFSGGEPTLYPELCEFVRLCRDHEVEHIAISTNGSAGETYYRDLVEAGANDFSVSLDGGCCSVGDMMAGGVHGAWSRVVDNVRMLAEVAYVSVGMVFTEQNVDSCAEAVLFADSLGVDDIRVIPSAQYNKALEMLVSLPQAVLARHAILGYRVRNIQKGVPVRGLPAEDQNKCWLAVDDMAVVQGHHYPCIIHLREGGAPIGRVGENMRQEREDWILQHAPQEDPICQANCLDVCVAYNRKASQRQNLDTCR